MKWFDELKPKPTSPPQSRQPKYTVERLEEVLAEFGPWRLQVADPEVKVLITQITWGVVPYVRSQGDPPSGAVVADALTRVGMLIQALDGYVKLQNGPQTGESASLMQQGCDALAAYWQMISTGGTAPVQDLAAYKAVTSYLSGNRAGQATDS